MTERIDLMGGPTYYFPSQQLIFVWEMFYPLAGLVLFMGAFILLTRKHRPTGWLAPFAAGSLEKMAREAVSLVFSRWWLLFVPFAIYVINPLDKTILQHIIFHFSPHNLQEYQKLCREITTGGFALHNQVNLNWVLNDCASALADALKIPLYIWRLHFGPIASIATIIILLAWAVHGWGRDSSADSNDQAPPTRNFLICLLLALGLTMSAYYSFIFYSSYVQDEFSAIDEMKMLFITTTSIISGIFTYTAMNSFWFGAVFRVAHGKKHKLIETVLKVFTAMLVIALTDGSLSEIESLIFITSSSFTVDMLIQGLAKVILAFALFPLPFIVAVNGPGLENGFRSLYRIWTHHFRKLLTLALVMVMASFIANIPFPMVQALLPEKVVTYEQCMSVITFPSAPYIALKAISVFLTMWSFVLVIVTFRSGELDLPEDEAPAALPVPEEGPDEPTR